MTPLGPPNQRQNKDRNKQESERASKCTHNSKTSTKNILNPCFRPRNQVESAESLKVPRWEHTKPENQHTHSNPTPQTSRLWTGPQSSPVPTTTTTTTTTTTERLLVDLVDLIIQVRRNQKSFGYRTQPEDVTPNAQDQDGQWLHQSFSIGTHAKEALQL